MVRRGYLWFLLVACKLVQSHGWWRVYECRGHIHTYHRVTCCAEADNDGVAILFKLAYCILNQQKLKENKNIFHINLLLFLKQNKIKENGEISFRRCRLESNQRPDSACLRQHISHAHAFVMGPTSSAMYLKSEDDADGVSRTHSHTSAWPDTCACSYAITRCSPTDQQSNTPLRNALM